jgi:hypothetical protein
VEPTNAVILKDDQEVLWISGCAEASSTFGC